MCTEVTKSSKTRLWVGIVLHYFEFWMGRAHLYRVSNLINFTPSVSVL